MVLNFSFKGYVYEEQALKFLGFKGSVAAGLGINNISESVHIFTSKVKMVSSGVKMLMVAREEQKKAEAQAKASEQTAASEPDAKTVGTLMETLWNVTVLDVEAVLRVVCTKVLKDSSVSYEDRVKRAEGIEVLS
jgi:hypothetical protein